jgi:hypothetical protein
MTSVFNSSLAFSAFMTIGPVAVLAALWITLRLRFYRSADQRHADEDSAGWHESAPSISLDRLLRRDDFDFLAVQRGYKPEIGAKLLRDRERIIRLYVRELASEFYRLHAKARELAAASPEPRGEIVGTLLRLHASFWLAMLRVEATLGAGRLIRLVSSRPGPARIEVGALLKCIEALRMDAARLNAPA